VYAQQLGDLRDHIHRDQIHQVHQEDPDKDGERKGSHQVVPAGKRAAHTPVDELNHPLDEILQPGRHTCGNRVGHFLEDIEKECAQKNGPEHGVQVNGIEAHCLGRFGAVGDGPAILGRYLLAAAVGTRRQITVSEIGEVVLDIGTGGQSVSRHCAQ